jgi:hypothetical protein
MMPTRSPDRSPRRNPRRTTAALALFVIVTLTGCTRALDDGASTIAPSDTPAPDVPEGDALATDGPDPVRVLLAAVVLTTGDVDAAIAEGLVTPEEVEAASTALAEVGTDALVEWIERARIALAAG